MEVKHPNSYQQGLTYRWIKGLSLFCFCLSLTVTGLSQTVIRGSAPAYVGSTISIRAYDNYITFTTSELATSPIDNDGSFELKIAEPHATVLLLEVEYKELTFYAIEGGVYEVEIGELELSTRPKLTVINGPDHDLNSLIPAFEDSLVSLTDDYYPYIVKSIKLDEVDSVFNALAAHSKKNVGAFMQVYVDYKIALVKQIIYKKQVSLFEQKYIINKPVQEDHMAYMQFITQYFNNYLAVLGAEVRGMSLRDLINSDKDVEGILALLKKDKRLANDTLNELVLLSGLYDLYGAPLYKEQMVLDLLDSLAVRTKIAPHIEMAKSIKSTLSHLRKGSMAPEFELLDSFGNKKKLSDFEGKYVYLHFWAHACEPCHQEMGVMIDLFKKYGGQVAFVNISLGKKQGNLDNATGRLGQESKMYFLATNGADAIKADYKIETLPSFVFIDKQGRILKAPAEPPSGNIEKTFSNNLLKKNNNTSISDPGVH
ncbi:MAG: TlpA family protein disulfide reductase [Flavobacteriales bacterium]|nr:TlpA family protein disulfide reductase [Flavobacteriales bacterium]